MPEIKSDLFYRFLSDVITIHIVVQRRPMHAVHQRTRGARLECSWLCVQRTNGAKSRSQLTFFQANNHGRMSEWGRREGRGGGGGGGGRVRGGGNFV